MQRRAPPTNDARDACAATRRRVVVCVALACVACALLEPALVHAQARDASTRRAQARTAQAADARDRVRVQYRGVALQRVISEIGEATDTRFVFGDDVRGVVTITVPKPVRKDEALELLRAALFVKGYAQVPAGGGAFKIVPIAMTPTDAEFVRRSLEGGSERAITTLVSLESVSADQVAETIKTLAPSSGAVIAYAPTNSIVLSGTEAALGRLIEVVRLLDEAAAEQLWARVIRYRDVEELVEVADHALNEGWSEANQIELFADARTNLLLARGTKERLDALRTFIDGFDRLTAGSGGIHVVRVLNRDPNEIVEIIQALQAGPRRARGDDREPPPDEPFDEADDDESGDGDDDGGDDAFDLPESETARSLEGLQFTLTADEPSRSIIVQAARVEAQVVADMIAELDRMPPRVAVEILYYEIRRPTEFLLSFDVVGTYAPDGSDGTGVRVQSAPGPGVGQRDPRNTGGAFGRIAGPPLVVPIVNPQTGETIETLEFPSNEGSINASKTGTVAALLSRPNLVATAGEDHEIFVGNNVPIPIAAGASTGAATVDDQSGAFVNPLVQRQTIEREDVGTRLRIKPTVGEAGNVQLEISFEISDVSPETIGGSAEEVGVTLVQRTLEATAVLRPGQYALLGMAEEKNVIEERSGVPWLMDIPGIGLLFSRIHERTVDTRILIAARARLLRTPADDVAESIRRRIAVERSLARVNDLERIPERPWAVRLSTFRVRDDARMVAAAFDEDGYVTRVTRWEASDGSPHWDVYLIGYADYETAATVALQATEADWDGEVLMVPAINELAPPE